MMTMTYRSITPSGPKSAAALTQIPPMAVVAKHAATFAWRYSQRKFIRKNEKRARCNWMNKMQLCPQVSGRDRAGPR